MALSGPYFSGIGYSGLATLNITTINQPTNQSINQSINQSLLRVGVDL